MKKIILPSVFLFFLCGYLSAATSVHVLNTGFQGKYIQADTENNPVAHFTIDTDPGGDILTYVSVENYLDSWYVGSASESDSVKENGIKVWYYAVDSSDFSPVSAQYVTHLPVDGSNKWYNSFNLPVADGSGIWITADIIEYPAGGSCEFQFEDMQFDSGASVSASGLPAAPPVMLITQAKPVDSLEISHSGGSMQPFISNSQENINAGEIKFFNNSDSGSAPVVVSSVTLTVKSYSPYGTLLAPSSVIDSLKIQDKNTGTIYGRISGPEVPSLSAPFSLPLSLLNVPAGMTITANIIISCTPLESSAGSNFTLSVDNSASIHAYDYYSLAPVNIQPSPGDSTGFPMDSNFAYIQKQASTVNISFNSLIPANINKGQQNVVLSSVVFSNPGDTLTAVAEAFNLTFSFLDSAGLPVSPASLFSKLAVTDSSGSVIYGVKSASTLENTGSTANFPLTGVIAIPAGSSVTVTVRADINPLTISTGFKAGLSAQSDILCRDRNSFSASASIFQHSLPSYTQLALLTSSCVMSNTPMLPEVIHKGSTSVPVMELSFSSPLSFGGGNLLIRGITLTCRDESGSALNFDKVFSAVIASYGGTETSLLSIPASDRVYLGFPEPVTVTAGAPIFRISASVKETASAKSVSLSIFSESDISRYQDNDPQRDIFIAPAAGTSFPASSGTAYVGGSSSGLSLALYPNPFRHGATAVVSYYLQEQQKVSIEIYDIMGNRVKTLIKDTLRQSGSRTEDFWDGTDDRGRPVNSGTYVARVSYAGGSMTKKITFIK